MLSSMVAQPEAAYDPSGASVTVGKTIHLCLPPSGSAGLDPTHDLGLGAQLPFDGIEPHAAAPGHGQEADLSSIPKLEDLQRLLDVHGPSFDGNLISRFLPPPKSFLIIRLFCGCHWTCGRPQSLTILSDANPFSAFLVSTISFARSRSEE